MRGRGLVALAAATAALGMLTACSPAAVDPGIPADSSGPLSLEQAGSLVEEPLAHLAEHLSAEVPGSAAFAGTATPTTGLVEGACTFTSTLYRSEQDVDGEGWRALAEEIRPQMEAWGMDTSAVADPSRPAGSALRGANSHNGAELLVTAWNGDTADAPDGPTLGLEMTVTVPLAETECTDG